MLGSLEEKKTTLSLLLGVSVTANPEKRIGLRRSTILPHVDVFLFTSVLCDIAQCCDYFSFPPLVDLRAIKRQSARESQDDNLCTFFTRLRQTELVRALRVERAHEEPCYSVLCSDCCNLWTKLCIINK